MKGLFNVGFRDEEFEGLKFKSGNKNTIEYYDELYEEGSHYSEVKYADMVDEDTMESIHIQLSYSLFFRLISIILLVVVLALTFAKMFWPSMVTLGISAVLFVLNIILTRKANEQYALRETTRSMISLVFSNRQKEIAEEKQAVYSSEGLKNK